MMFRSAFTTACLLIAATALGGCTESVAGWSNRYGPNPKFQVAEIRASVSLRNEVMTSFLDSTGDGDDRYYLATLNGFNFVDEQCDLYLRELFALEQSRNRIKKGIDSTGLLTNAILAANQVSSTSMGIVTQAFGLTSEYTDTLANSYLYGLSSTTIFSFVKKFQAAYRDQTELDAGTIRSAPVAYARIRGYLQLCMPPTIESKIDETVKASAPLSDAAGKRFGKAGSALQVSAIP